MNKNKLKWDLQYKLEVFLDNYYVFDVLNIMDLNILKRELAKIIEETIKEHI